MRADEQRQKAVTALIATVLVTASCTIDVRPRLEATDRLLDQTAGKVTKAHLKACQDSIDKMRDTFGKKMNFHLTGPLRVDRKVTCTFLDAFWTASPFVYYTAPGYFPAGHEPGISALFPSPEGSKFLWCRFRLNEGKVVLEASSIGLQARKLQARICGLQTTP